MGQRARSGVEEVQKLEGSSMARVVMRSMHGMMANRQRQTPRFFIMVASTLPEDPFMVDSLCGNGAFEATYCLSLVQPVVTIVMQVVFMALHVVLSRTWNCAPFVNSSILNGMGLSFKHSFLKVRVLVAYQLSCRLSWQLLLWLE